MIAGVMVLGISTAELMTELWLENHLKLILALVAALLGLFIISSYLTGPDRKPWDFFTPLKFLSYISGSYLLIACWASFANNIDKPFTRSLALIRGAQVSYIIGLAILEEITALAVPLIDRALMIIVVIIVSASLAWSSVIEVEKAERSLNKWIRAWRAIQAIFFTFIAPLLPIFVTIMTVGFSSSN